MKTAIFLFCLFNFCVQFDLVHAQNNEKITQLLLNPYESKMISRGDNHPEIDLSIDSLDKILILLHHRIETKEIKNYFKLSDQKFRSKIDLLKKNAFIKEYNSTYLPTVMVIGLDDGVIMKSNAEIFATSIINLIENKNNEIKNKYFQIKAFEKIPLDTASLFIYSNVLLDNWQINNVEKLFLKKPRTERHGKNYYMSLCEKEKNSPFESFGIYGNNVSSKKNYVVCIYGNSRYTEYSQKRIIKAEKDYLNLINQPSQKINYPIIDRLSDQQLSDIASLITDDLVKIFENRKEELYKFYSESKYSEEISFEEYFIWFYHILYTVVTNKLTENKIIYNPNVNYIYFYKN